MGSNNLMHTRGIRCAKLSLTNIQQRDHLADLGINERIILKLDSLVGCHEHYNGSLHSIIARSVWTAG